MRALQLEWEGLSFDKIIYCTISITLAVMDTFLKIGNCHASWSSPLSHCIYPKYWYWAFQYRNIPFWRNLLDLWRIMWFVYWLWQSHAAIDILFEIKCLFEEWYSIGPSAVSELILTTAVASRTRKEVGTPTKNLKLPGHPMKFRGWFAVGIIHYL